MKRSELANNLMEAARAFGSEGTGDDNVTAHDLQTFLTEHGDQQAVDVLREATRRVRTDKARIEQAKQLEEAREAGKKAAETADDSSRNKQLDGIFPTG